MKPRPLAIVTLAAVIAVGTWFAGWWMVPVLAAGWQAWRPRSAPVLVAVAAILGWAALLMLLPPAPLLRLLGRLAGLFHLPVWAMALTAPIYAGLLAWSAARIVAALDPRRAATAPASRR